MSTRASSPPDPERSPRGNVFTRAGSSLKHSRDFRFLWLSNLFFIGGNWALTLVLSWLVFETTHSELLLAIFTAARLSPMWFGPLSGLMADRYDRVTIIKVASIWSFAIVSTLGLLVNIGSAPYAVLLIGGVLAGLAQSPSQPSRSSLMLQLVGRKNLANANALNSMAMGITQGVAPALGGLIISGFGAAAALWFSSLWYLIGAILIWQIRSPKRHTVRVDHEPIGSMITGGLRIILKNQLTTTVLVITLAANFLIWPIYNSFMPVFAKDVLDLGPAGLGRLLMFGGMGSFLGAFIIASLGDFRYKGGVFVIGTTIWGAGWAMFGLSQTASISYVLMFCIGLISATFGVLQATLMLMTSVPEVHGRALGILELAIGAMPIGSLGLGIAARSWGVGMTTFAAGSLFVLILIVHAVRVPDLVRYTGDEVETEIVGV